MKIAIDLDGVTWDVHKHLLQIYNEKYRTNFTLQDITYWDFLPEDRFWECYKEMVKKIMDFEPIDWAIGRHINFLYNFFDVSFLTHGIYTVDNIEKKLRTWNIFKHLSYDSIILEDYKTPKVIYEFEYFIDDNPKMVMKIRVYPEKTLLLFTQPWNKDVDVNNFENVIRVDNWKEIQNYFFNVRFWSDKYARKM